MNQISTPLLEALCVGLGVYDQDTVTSLGHTDLANMALPFLRNRTAAELRELTGLSGDFSLESFAHCTALRVEGDQVLTAGNGLPTMQEQLAAVNTPARNEALAALTRIDQQIQDLNDQFLALVQDGMSEEEAADQLQDELDRLQEERAEANNVALNL